VLKHFKYKAILKRELIALANLQKVLQTDKLKATLIKALCADNNIAKN
jgi:hypothetical protein